MKNAGQTKSQKLENTGYWTAMAVLLIAATIVLSFAAMEQNNSAQQSTFTSLFFGSYDKNISGNAIAFSFVIENHEGKKIDYIVDISIDSAPVKTIPVSLENGKKRTETVSLPASFSDKNSHKVSVRLRGRPEQIFFWANQ